MSDPVPAGRRPLPLPALPPLSLLVPASVAFFALTGALLLVVAEFTPLLQVQVITEVVKTVKTGPHHSYAQLLVALAAAGMALLHLRTGRRAPLLALAALGAIALLIGIVNDLPDTHATGVIGERFEDAKASARGGLWLELLGGVGLLLGAGVGLLLEGRGAGRPAATRDTSPA